MPTKKAKAAGALPDSYFELVRRFPLVSIRDDAQLDRASAMLKDVLQMDYEGDAGTGAYLDALTDLVEMYESARFPTSHVTPRELLSFLMNQHELTQEKLASAVDMPQSTISAILGGKRAMTVEHMNRLAAHFGLPGRAFMPR